MPIPEAFRPIIDVLDQATAMGTAGWKETAIRGEFFVATAGNAVKIYPGPKRTGMWADSLRSEITKAIVREPHVGIEAEPTSLTVEATDAEGNEIDSFFIDQADPDFWVVRRVYDGAKRKARQTDAALRSLTEKLQAQLLKGVR